MMSPMSESPNQKLNVWADTEDRRNSRTRNADSLSKSISHSICSALKNRSQKGSIGVSAPMQESEEEVMRNVYLRCIQTNPREIFSELALPLQEELLNSE